MLTRRPVTTLTPEFSVWQELVSSATGQVFEKTLREWQTECRNSLGLRTEKPVIIVGHQPTFFHPGILAKFIAADRFAREINGELVYLVVDHHKGESGQLQTPNAEIDLASLQKDLAMCDQPRVEINEEFEPISSALQEAKGENAASQFANALVLLMEPWATVNHVITATELLETGFGTAIVNEMQSRPSVCRTSYNTALEMYPEVRIPHLNGEELPLWKGNNSLHPRALVLTLLARLVACDLFVHGSGGMLYDQAMEHWCKSWLGCSPCSAVLATATVPLATTYLSMTDARREYYSPSFDVKTKAKFLDAIEEAPYNSPQRQIQFQKMHQWLRTVQPTLDIDALKYQEATAKRRTWAFPLYSVEQLDTLRDLIFES